MSTQRSQAPSALGGTMLPKWFWLAAFAGVVSVIVACTLDNPQAGDLSGPSELGTSIEMRAVPDSLVADGFSSSIIEAVVRNANGERQPGRTIQFDITTQGAPPPPGVGVGFLDLGNLAPVNGPRPVAGGVESGPVSAVTDGTGVARARYWAPFRTDQENDTTVRITGREASTNFADQTLRTVTIFLRAANRPSFPGTGTCDFIVEPQDDAYAVGETIFFTATQINGTNGRPIARYEWDFGDGSARDEGRNTGHVYTSAGTGMDSTFTVTLFTTESVTGAQEMCTKTITVTPSGSPPPPPPPPCASPTATFSASQVCSTGEILADGANVTIFDASASTSGSADETISSFSWALGNGSGASGPSVSVVYGGSLVGFNIAVTLTVTNSCGASSSTTQNFDVVDPCP